MEKENDSPRHSYCKSLFALQINIFKRRR